MVCYHSGGVRQGERQTAHQYMVAGNDLIQLKGCIQSKLFTLELTICG